VDTPKRSRARHAANWYEFKASAKASDPVEIWIYDEIGADIFGDGLSAKSFVKDLSKVKADAISLHINSPGGDVFEGQAIYNALRRHPAHVTSYVDGVAASIASVVALAADEVVMASNAMFMIHEPWAAVIGTAGDMRSTADVLEKIRGSLVEIYAERSSRDPEAIAEAMAAETWLSAEEASDWGFADVVGDELKVAARFDWNALGYRKVPDILAAAETAEDDAAFSQALDEAAERIGQVQQETGRLLSVIDLALAETEPWEVTTLNDKENR
jgi:ATP-dependent Clp endopeptidase proteolytic subunit ClpP